MGRDEIAQDEIPAATDQKAGGSNPSRRAKKTRNLTVSGLFVCISCCFLPLLFHDPNADPNGSGQRKPSDGTGEDAPHRLRCFQLSIGGDVGVGVQREARGVVTQHRGHRDAANLRLDVVLEEALRGFECG